MSRFEFRLPDIGEGIAEAEIVSWHVAVGDRVAEDQGLADLMTDKATVEMESPVAGIVTALAGEIGDRVAIGSTLVVIELDDGGQQPPPSPRPVPAHGTEIDEESEPAPSRRGRYARVTG